MVLERTNMSVYTFTTQQSVYHNTRESVQVTGVNIPLGRTEGMS
jgi:hypothetical protein